ncbi:MAG TPA: hypothetical protein VFD10_02050 [Atribacterota bacterium]|nr:hypothetical protein [Atribacterota bacterium]
MSDKAGEAHFKFPVKERAGKEKLRSLQVSLSRIILTPKHLLRRGDFESSLKKYF